MPVVISHTGSLPNERMKIPRYVYDVACSTGWLWWQTLRVAVSVNSVSVFSFGVNAVALYRWRSPMKRV